MKKNIFSFVMAAIAAMTIFASCDNKNIDLPSAVVSSDVICNISVAGTYNNLTVVPSDGGENDVVVNMNVPCMSYTGDGYASGLGCAFNREKGVSDLATGKVNFIFQCVKNEGYTVDCAYSMIQSRWGETWVDYTRYGHLETDVNFRIRGVKGERILDFDDPDNWSAENAYYLKGKVLAISDIAEETKDFETLPLFEPTFKQLNFHPVLTSYSSQSCVLTVATEKGTVDIQVFGKKRDNELSRLLENIKKDDNIEFPAFVKNKDKLMEKMLEPIKVSAVLKLD